MILACAIFAGIEGAAHLGSYTEHGEKIGLRTDYRGGLCLARATGAKRASPGIKCGRFQSATLGLPVQIIAAAQGEIARARVQFPRGRLGVGAR